MPLPPVLRSAISSRYTRELPDLVYFVDVLAAPEAVTGSAELIRSSLV